MSTATAESSQPTPPAQPTVPVSGSGRTPLLTASFIGAAIILLGIVAGAYAAQSLASTSLIEYLPIPVLVWLAAIMLSFLAVSLILGKNAPKGTRGGIFLVLTTIFSILFIARGVGLFLADVAVGMYVTVGVLCALVFLGYKFLTSDRAHSWMIGIEEQGWFSFFSFKKTQGLHLRRYTIIGVLLIGWSGVYSIYKQQTFSNAAWNLNLPFMDLTIPLMPRLDYAVPVLLALVTFWIGYRLVNMPVFADFLIATEAEMNKVSWSTRKRLIQDTIVVLVTMLIITLFLLIIDLFWGWILSVKYIEVLPKRQDSKQQRDSSGQQRVQW